MAAAARAAGAALVLKFSSSGIWIRPGGNITHAMLMLLRLIEMSKAERTMNNAYQ